MLRVMAATAAYGAAHSVLASRAAKEAAAHLLGHRARDAFYRPFYIAQSVAALGLLAAYARRQPDRELYRVTGVPALLMRAGQVAGLGAMAWGAREVGLAHLTGSEGLSAWARGDAEVPPGNPAQGPAPLPGGGMKATGPFRHARHPLNLAPLPVFWLQPRMTTNLLAFNLAATAYLVLGSLHEEARLQAAYGRAYEGYRRSGVPFYLPRMTAAPAPGVDGPPGGPNRGAIGSAPRRSRRG
jgi:hypothetical protein